MYALGDKMQKLSSMENLIVDCNLISQGSLWMSMPGPEGIKPFFMLKAAEHGIFPAHKC